MKSTSNYPIPSRLWVPEFNNIATNSPVSSSPWKPSKKTSKTTIKTLLSLSLKLASWLVHVSSFSQENKHHIRFRFSVLSFLSIKKMKHLVKSCFSVLFFFNQDNTFSFSFFTLKKKKKGSENKLLTFFLRHLRFRQSQTTEKTNRNNPRNSSFSEKHLPQNIKRFQELRVQVERDAKTNLRILLQFKKNERAC